ncbi:HNH endonuclease family protein [Bradyrhizobium guangdongense]
MATNDVNLDALIPREDFAVDRGRDWAKPDRISISELRPNGFFYNQLRKPDFQRETSNWSPEKIEDFVKTFLEGDLIPAIILWSAGETIFVIDGAHRLSALIAWVHGDYGDGPLSRNFYANFIPPEQERAAQNTHQRIKNSIGTYEEHLAAIDHPTTSRAIVAERAKRLGSLGLQLQWVPAADAKKAEASFFKINQAATAIDPTELRILRARTSPNALAARVIVRNATGHKYWSQFPSETQQELEDIGKEVYTALFRPPLDSPIRTLDLPVAGRGYSGQTLPLIFELINLANGIKIVDATRKKIESPLPSDADGTQSLAFLKNARRLVRRISGTHPSSLGLHPAVYFYSETGRHQPTAVLGAAALVRELDTKNSFNSFTRVRRDFEDFILSNKNFINQIQRKYGALSKGYDWIKALYIEVLEQLWNGKKRDEIVEALKKHPKFTFLSSVTQDQEEPRKGKSFDRDTKSATFLREALENPIRCAICGGLIHRNSMQIDHDVRKREGGGATLENAQLAHPYCNSTYKQ